MFMKRRVILVLCLLCRTVFGQVANPAGDESVKKDVLPAYRFAWELGPTGTFVSLRGLHAVDDEIVWASGAEGTVIVSPDGGSSWTNCSPQGFHDVEFRCVHAWSREEACIASAGTPAVILRTADGGQSWQECYRSDSELAFFDAMKFWDAHNGCAVSDPVDGRLLVVETNDGGRIWRKVPNELLPNARDGEAAFAASNSSLCLGENGQLWFGTGGTTSRATRLYHREQWNERWNLRDVPMPSGPAEGIFAIARRSTSASQTGLPGKGRQEELVAVGGDYRPEAASSVVACISQDSGRTWRVVTTPPPGYRSAVVTLPAAFETAGFIAAGPSGTDYSPDGDVWFPVSENGFHALSVGKQRVFACGSEGRFAVLTLLF